MSLDETSVAWLRRKNGEFRHALERRDFSYAIDYMAMFAEMHKDASLDDKNASLDLAQAYENTALMLEGTGSHAEAQSFASRALKMRERVDRTTLLEMIARPIEIPDLSLPAEGYFEHVLRDIVAGVWQTAGLPRQVLRWDVAVDQPWRYCAACGDFVFWLFDLESKEADEHRRTGRDMFMQMAGNPASEVKPDTEGGKIREQVICRGALRIRRLQETQTPRWMLIGWYLSRLLMPRSK